MRNKPRYDLHGVNEIGALTTKDILKFGLRILACAAIAMLGFATGAEHGLVAGLGMAAVITTIVGPIDVIAEKIIGD